MADFYYGSVRPSAMYVGTSGVTSAYFGGTKIFPYVNPIWSGLTAYYRLEDVNDSVNSNTLTNTAVTFAAAKNNNGGVFDGNTAKLQRASTSDLTQNSYWTISVWVYPTVWTSGDFIVAKGAFPYGPRLSLWVNTYKGFSTIMTLSGGDGYLVNNVENSGWAINNWYHLILSYNPSSGNMILTVNGSSSTTTKTGTQQADANPYTIGQYYAADLYGFNGKIDEVAIWHRELSSTEKTSLYNSGTGLFY